MESRVPVVELGVSVGEAEAAGLDVGPDWMQRPSVALDDAAAWFADRQAVTEEHERLWAEHLADSRRWQEARAAVVRIASAEARAKVRSGSPGEQFAAGQWAGTKAAADFERTTPRPVWSGNGRPSVGLEYIDEGDRHGVRRVVAAARSRLPDIPAGVESEVSA